MKAFVAVIGIFVCCGIGLTMATRLGGIGEVEQQSDPEVQGFVQALNSDIKSSALALFAGANGAEREKVETHFKTASVTPLSYKTQIVSGMNYFVKTKIGDYIFHLRIYRDIKGHLTLTKVVGPKKESDPIEYIGN